MGYEMFEKLCLSRGVRPYQVAKATGVSTATLSSWKNGRYTPKADKLTKIAEYFEVPVEYFQGVEESRQQAGYYLDDDTAMIAQEIFEDPDLRVLFDAARDSTPGDIKLAAEFLKRLKRTNPDE